MWVCYHSSSALGWADMVPAPEGRMELLGCRCPFDLQKSTSPCRFPDKSVSTTTDYLLLTCAGPCTVWGLVCGLGA